MLIGQYKMQTAECRLQTGYKMQSRYEMETADCRLGIQCRPRANLSLRQYDIFSSLTHRTVMLLPFQVRFLAISSPYAKTGNNLCHQSVYFLR